MKYPFTNPDYATVLRWFEANRGKTRSAKVTAAERETRAYWKLPYLAGSMTIEAFESPGQYVWQDEDGSLRWRMHHTDIVRWYPDGTRMVWHGGWLHSWYTRDALRVLARVDTRVLPERVYAGRIRERNRLILRGQHELPFGLPFDCPLLMLADGTPLRVEGVTDEVRTTDEVRRREALAFKRRVLRQARAVYAVLPQHGARGDHAVTPSINACANYLLAMRNAADDAGLAQVLVDMAVLEQTGGVVMNPPALLTMVQIVLYRALYDAFDVYQWHTLPCAVAATWLPKR